MKVCPNCGSILADFEPYCTNCCFDPDFDSRNWKPDGHSSKINYYPGKRIKNPDPYVLGKEADWALCIVAWSILMCMIFIFYVQPFLSNIWQYNHEVITFLFFIIVFIVIAYGIFYLINNYLEKKQKKNRKKDKNK